MIFRCIIATRTAYAIGSAMPSVNRSCFLPRSSNPVVKGGVVVAGDPGRILIVDDDEGFRAFVAQLLTRAGFPTPLEVATGEAALEAVRAERPTLVLLDVFLPGINGFEVCR